MVNRSYYIKLAKLFRYPAESFITDVEDCLLDLWQVSPEAAAELKLFYDYMKSQSSDHRQELFTKTFDVQPICYLDLGYVMFGEDYKRGAFLLSMQHEQLKAGNDCGTELPDHICNVLNLMAISDEKDFIHELVHKVFQPCLDKMVAEFGMARVDLKIKVLRKMHKAIIQEELNRGNVYRHCFLAMQNVLQHDFGKAEAIEPWDNPVVHTAHHKSFFNKQQSLVNNYKLD
jgi:nitrate reductase assembly molybdenum cofactor insertion protein NarJ